MTWWRQSDAKKPERGAIILFSDQRKEERSPELVSADVVAAGEAQAALQVVGQPVVVAGSDGVGGGCEVVITSCGVDEAGWLCTRAMPARIDDGARTQNYIISVVIK